MRLSDLIKTTPSKNPEEQKEAESRALKLATHQDIPPPSPAAPPASSPEPHLDHIKADDNNDDTTGSRPHSSQKPETPVFEKKPAGIYELARQMGIDIPDDREAIVERVRRRLRDVFNAVLKDAELKELILPTITAIVIDLDKAVSADTNIVTDFHRYFVQEERLIWHSLYTAIIAMELAKKNNEPTPLHDIGCAALVHDIGWLAIHKSYNTLGDINNPEYRNHVEKGVKILSSLSISQTIIDMVAQHHEQLDGQGFPKGIRGGEFSTAGQILALANIFEHAVVDLAFPEKVPAQNEKAPEDLSSLVHHYRKAYNSELLKQMIHVIGFYPVGSIVELNNHAICMVIKQNRGMPLRPVLEMVVDTTGSHPDEKKIIDLKEARMLSIIRMVTDQKMGRKK
jgi:putative nucleotidyltransferase with HDIG domain